MSFEVFAWLLVPLVPALIALYFLKLKRREVMVSSTFLWKKSLEDLHVNSPFQRLRRSLLLLLQLLVLIGLILAASRPVTSWTEGGEEAGRSTVLLIDNSASMNVRETDGTRLQIARRKAHDVIAGMKEKDLGCVIVFSNRATLLQPLTRDRARLRAAIGSIQPTSRPTDFLTALETAQSVAEAARGAEVVVLSDGSFEELSKVAPELERVQLTFIAIGADRPNVGIVELDVNRDFSRAQRAEIFVAVQNSGPDPVSATVNLLDGDQLLDVAVLELAPGRSSPHIFDGSTYSGRVLRVEVEPGGALADDDEGWVRVDPPRPVDILLVGSDWFLERLISVRPLYKARRITLETYRAMAEDGRLDDDPADVIIFDGAAPDAPPERSALYIGCHPRIPELLGEVEGAASDGNPDDPPRRLERVEMPAIFDWDQVHPVNRGFINFADLLVTESFVFPEGPRYHSFIESTGGSIAGTLVLTPPEKPSVSLVLLGFGIEESNWPWLPSFPMFFSNVITWLGSVGGGTAEERYRTGSPLVATLPPDVTAELIFRDPDGNEIPAQRNRAGEVSHTETDRRGVYELLAGEQVLERFPVSLLDHGESRITPGKEIRVGSGQITEATDVPETRELWKWFASLALIFVLLEWWLYNRRMTI